MQALCSNQSAKAAHPPVRMCSTGFACLSSDTQASAKLNTSKSAAARPVDESLSCQQQPQQRGLQKPQSFATLCQQVCGPQEGLITDGVMLPQLQQDMQQDMQRQPAEHAQQGCATAEQADVRSSSGGQLQQQLPDLQEGCSQMSQLFSQPEMLEDDLKAYAALVHEQKAQRK